MAPAYQLPLRSKANDEEQDHIGSNSSTPPGAATPRPDLTDKRLPGILHNYFGQVRDSLRTRLNPTDTSPLVTPPATSREGSQELGLRAKCGGTALPTAPNSPTDGLSESEGASPLLPHGQLAAPPYQTSQSDIFCPTPPTSSSSSMYKGSSHVSGLDGSGTLPSTLRRHTLASSPLHSVVAETTVTAAHISNPATSLSSSTRATPTPSHSRALQHLVERKSKLLTEGDISPTRYQNTPPQTPRALSQETKTTPTPPVTSTPSLPDVPEAKEKPSGSGVSSTGAVGPPKGQLSVDISEGRGLRPSTDPYVVCQFQWNEYISDGPKSEDMDTRQDTANDDGTTSMRRIDNDTGRPLAIPMKSRQSSTTELRKATTNTQVTDPKWEHHAMFDVVGEHSEIDISVYDRSNQEAFIGHVRFSMDIAEFDKPIDGWFKLESREGEEGHTTGEIHLRVEFRKTDKKTYGPEDFQILKLIGKGTFGQVFQVRKKDTKRIYAMKVLSKKVIVQKKEIAHTLGERNILVRTATADSPFIVGLKFSFQTATDLYLVTDYMSGGELFWHLQKEGRFHEGRAKFYIAELILALEHLHEHDIVYRDLKPENILLDANGHIALCDFGLSKANLTKDDTTNTFCGTTEYLAPEVLLDEHGYTKMVDFWSLGVLVFEMCCGWSPFYAEDTQQMYKNIAFGKVRFPRDALSNEGRNFVKGLLNRNPKHRLGAIGDARELKAHPFFNDIDWYALGKKNLVPPFKPKLKSELDTSNFDPEFTNALTNTASSLNARAAALASGINTASTPLSPTMQAKFQGFTFVDESAMDNHFRENDLGRMVEDERENGEDVEEAFGSERGDRMSGVVQTGEPDGVFNEGHFDM
ncbi:Serine/threonine-protein kinase [Cryomyces antarcticus]|nr:Serine/threonine-protein kinase [Cryomyces antarcticus]